MTKLDTQETTRGATRSLAAATCGRIYSSLAAWLSGRLARALGNPSPAFAASRFLPAPTAGERDCGATNGPASPPSCLRWPRGREVPPQGRGRPRLGGGARSARGRRVSQAGAPQGRRRRREEAAAAAGAGAGVGAGPRESGGREARRPREEAGPERGRQARDALPRPLGGAGPGRAGVGGPGAAGRPGADPERRGVCARRPPRARLLPPRVRRRPSARTSSIRPDRPPAPRPSITPAGAGGGAGHGAGGGRAGRGETPECTRERGRP